MTWLWLAFAAYLAGSIPFGVLLARMRGVDIRRVGSGNIGATNVGRMLGRPLGTLCLALDMLKGFAPTAIAGLVMGTWGGVSVGARDMSWWMVVAAAAVAGHMFSPFLLFRGGKGVATGLGACLGMYPWLTLPALSSVLVWIVVVRVWRYVGLASCVAAAALPIFVWLWHDVGVWARISGSEGGVGGAALAPLYVGTALLGVLVLVRHRGNLARIARGAEPRVGESRADAGEKV